MKTTDAKLVDKFLLILRFVFFFVKRMLAGFVVSWSFLFKEVGLLVKVMLARFKLKLKSEPKEIFVVFGVKTTDERVVLMFRFAFREVGSEVKTRLPLFKEREKPLEAATSSPNATSPSAASPKITIYPK